MFSVGWTFQKKSLNVQKKVFVASSVLVLKVVKGNYLCVYVFCFPWVVVSSQFVRCDVSEWTCIYSMTKLQLWCTWKAIVVWYFSSDGWYGTREKITSQKGVWWRKVVCIPWLLWYWWFFIDAQKKVMLILILFYKWTGNFFLSIMFYITECFPFKWNINTISNISNSKNSALKEIMIVGWSRSIHA